MTEPRFAPWRPWDLADAYRVILAAIPMGRQCVGHVRQVLALTQHKGPDDAFRAMTAGAARLPQSRRNLIVLAALYVLDRDLGYLDQPKYPAELVEVAARNERLAMVGSNGRVDIWRSYLVSGGGKMVHEWRIWHVNTGCAHGCVAVDVLGVPNAPGLYIVTYHAQGELDVSILMPDGYDHRATCEHTLCGSKARRLGDHEIIGEVNKRAAVR